MNCHTTTDKPSNEYLKRFSDLCELATGIPYLVDQYRQANDAANQWYEVAKGRKRLIDDMRRRISHLEELRTQAQRVRVASKDPRIITGPLFDCISDMADVLDMLSAFPDAQG
jgi:hypothetical protein